MSHRKAKQIMLRAQSKLAKHKSGDPEFELDEDTILFLEEEIELAQEHLQEDEDSHDPIK
jgi:hypothetical protein